MVHFVAAPINPEPPRLHPADIRLIADLVSAHILERVDEIISTVNQLGERNERMEIFVRRFVEEAIDVDGGIFDRLERIEWMLGVDDDLDKEPTQTGAN